LMHVVDVENEDAGPAEFDQVSDAWLDDVKIVFRWLGADRRAHDEDEQPSEKSPDLQLPGIMSACHGKIPAQEGWFGKGLAEIVCAARGSIGRRFVRYGKWYCQPVQSPLSDDPPVEFRLIRTFNRTSFRSLRSGIGCCVLFVWASALVLVTIGSGRGARLLKTGVPEDRKRGILLILECAMLPLFCYFGPPYFDRVVYGNFPIGSYEAGKKKIKEGMTKEQVESLLGPPHGRSDRSDGSASWYYWIDSFGIAWFGVQFGTDGRVTGAHGN
jgi:SmpA / OmlA family